MTCLSSRGPPPPPKKKHETLNAAVELVADLLCKRQVSVSNLDPNVGYHDRHIS